MLWRGVILVFLCLGATLAQAQDKRFSLSAPTELVETGFLKHLLPRFSLKTGIRIEVNGADPKIVISDGQGEPVFQGSDILWRMEFTDDPHVARFRDWLRSDVGRRTIMAYAPDGAQMFSVPEAKAVVAKVEVLEGDAVAGEHLSLTLCGRCHVINEKNRMNGMGSTPSFKVLRTLPRWQERFETFYVLNPHPAFTQVEDVTLPFDPARPSPIVPIEMTLDDLESILAYVSLVEPADLGAPIQSQ